MNQVWFEAENDEQAKELINKVIDDELAIPDLPAYYERNRGIDLDFSVSTLEDENFKVVIY